MRAIGKWLGRGLLGLVVLGGGLYLLGPREAVTEPAPFDPAAIGSDPDAYLAAAEARFADITPGAEKRIVWAGEKGVRTEVALVYLHGFSATSEEIRPVPEIVASALHANLFYTRLTGHGQDGAALAEARAGDWLADLDEALAVAATVGDRVILLTTSTGGTLAAIAATDPARAAKIAGIVFISPNFGLNSTAAFILDLPLVRWWGPVVAGAERSFVPQNDLHARYWTLRYPTAALFPMAALVRHAKAQDFAATRVPALFMFAPTDQVVSAQASQAVADRWGGPVEVELVTLGVDDDPYAHVIAGDALSPSQTMPTALRILDWVGGR